MSCLGQKPKPGKKSAETPLRVLLITREPWRDDSNEGSVLSGWFADQPFETAQIYCKPGLPQNNICGRCLQLTDKMALESILKRKPMGRPLTARDAPAAPAAPEKENKRFYDFFRRNNWEVFHLLRGCLWAMGNYKSEPLKRFILDFAPDVIFAPFCYDRYVLDIQRWASELTGAPLAGVIWDDIYSYGRSRSPFFLLNRMLLRRSLKKSVAACSRIFTLCPQQANAFTSMLGSRVSVLPKAADPVDKTGRDRGSSGPVRLIYGGGLYYGRDRMLAAIAQTLQDLKKQGTDCRLDIYTNTGSGGLDNGSTCFVHPAVPMDRLREEYAQSDIALHVEDLSAQNAAITRLSFSSKIVDCLAGGCAVLAVGPAGNAGIQYLRQQNAALCVDDLRALPNAVKSLVCDPALLQKYRQAAYECLKKNHTAAEVRLNLKEALEGLD